jgi:uncharacterized membrane protein (DUF106 family)
MKNNKVEFVQDERQKMIGHKSLAVTCIFLMVCMSVATIYDMITADTIGWEFWGLLGACVVMAVARRLMGDIEEPKDLFNRPLPLGYAKQDKQKRKLNYALNSALFGLACGVFDILLALFGKNDSVDYDLTQLLFPSLGKWATVAVTAVMAFVTAFVISYVIDYLLGEHKIKKYNQMLKELDED